MSEELLASRPGTVLLGWFPGAVDRPVLSVPPGATVVVDTVAHQGLTDRHGRDPVAYFAALGVPADDVADDVRAIAAGTPPHDPAVDGPHVVTGPVEVRGARPGDVLAVRIDALEPRTDHGVVGPRHGRGPTRLRRLGRIDPVADAGFALRPSLGVMGVATSDGLRRRSTRVGTFGGNLDLPELTTGATLHLPVQAHGALFHVGAPHFAFGPRGTVWDGPLRATLRLDVIPQAEVGHWSGAGRRPYVTTAHHLVPLGLDADVDRALAQCRAQAYALLSGRYGIPGPTARAALDTADFRIHRSGHGVHARLPLPRHAEVGAA